MSPWRFALGRLARHKGPFAMALLWSVLFILVPMQVPVITGAVIDSLKAKRVHLYGVALDPAQRRRTVEFAALALLGVAAAHGLAAYLRQLSVNKLTRRFVCDMRHALIDRISLMPLERQSEFGTGELFHRVIVDTARLRRFAGQVVIRSATNILRVTFPVTLLFMRQPLLAAAVSAVIPLQWALVFNLQKKVHRARIEARHTRSRFVTMVKEQLDGTETIQSLGAVPLASARARREADQLERQQLVQADRSAMSSAVIWVMTSLGFALAWGLGGLRVLHGQMTAGELVSFAGLLVFVYAPFRRFAGAMGTSQQILSSLEHIQELLRLPAAPVERPGARPISLGEGRIELHEVSFGYGRQPVLRQVSLVIQPRRLTILTGPSGSGKTTLLRLMNRLYDPVAGRVLVDNIDVREFTVASLRSAIALVPQRPMVFTGTIADNLRLAAPEAGDAELLAACQAVDLLGFVQRLEDGLQTRLGQGGIQPSGGEAQRLAIARALLLRPRVLLLDEPTSALDLESQATIMSTLGRLKNRFTVLIASHRVETLSHADWVVTLNRGRVVRQGRPAVHLPPSRSFRPLPAPTLGDLETGAHVQLEQR